MNFQPTVTLGELLAGLGMGFSSLLMYALFVIRQDKKLALLAQEVGQMAKTLAGVERILDNQAKAGILAAATSQRLLMLEKLVDELRHGDGLVVKRFMTKLLDSEET